MAKLNVAIGTIFFPGPELLREALQVIADNGIQEIDSGQMYGTNEADLGEANTPDLNLILSTKSKGGFDGGNALKPDVLYRDAHTSLERLKVKQVDIFYIHAADRSETGKLENWVPTIDKLYKEGVFRRFGVSNFSPQEVKELYDYAKANNFVLPSVFQGNYNAISRNYEQTLFPLLRERGIVFYAYSPIAGGYLAKSKAQILEGTDAGRFNKDDTTPVGAVYKTIYSRESFHNALDTWQKLAEAEGITRAELAYRWVYYHSALKPENGDFVIIGASKFEQITSTVDGLKKGPLKQETAKGIEGVWEAIKHDSILDEDLDLTQTLPKA